MLLQIDRGGEVGDGAGGGALQGRIDDSLNHNWIDRSRRRGGQIQDTSSRKSQWDCGGNRIWGVRARRG